MRQEGPTGSKPQGQGTFQPSIRLASTGPPAPLEGSGQERSQSYSPNVPYTSPVPKGVGTQFLGQASGGPPPEEDPELAEDSAVTSRSPTHRSHKRRNRRLMFERDRGPSTEDLTSESEVQVESRSAHDPGGGEVTQGSLGTRVGPRVRVRDTIRTTSLVTGLLRGLVPNPAGLLSPVRRALPLGRGRSITKVLSGLSRGKDTGSRLVTCPSCQVPSAMGSDDPHGMCLRCVGIKHDMSTSEECAGMSRPR